MFVLYKVLGTMALATTSVMALIGTTAVKVTMAPKSDATRASGFCSAIGNPVAPSVPGVAALQGSATRYFQPTRPVSFAGIADLELDPAANRIISYRNTGLNRYYQLHSQPAGVGVSEATALAQAQMAVQQSGQGKEIADPTINLQFLSQSRQAGDGSWWVRWPRAVNGIPYRDDNLVVQIDAETGIVRGFSANFWSIPPVSTATGISRDAAVATASAVLDGSYKGRYVFHWADLKIVGYNGRWQNGQLQGGSQPTLYDKPSKVAWVCAFSVPPLSINPRIGPRPIHAEVWIDAQTGGIIGGKHSTAR